MNSFHFCVLLLPIVAATVAPVPAAADGAINVDREGLAIQGYDPVAYFDGAPAVGLESITAEHGGAIYRFASEQNRETFLADPDRFVPRYGGFCAYAASLGKKVKIDPLAWDVVDGRLYLNYSPSIRKKWRKDIPGYVARADERWPGLAGER